MVVELERLDTGEPRRVGVGVTPARLHHAHVVVEARHRVAQEAGRRSEVGVEDGYQLAAGRLQPVGQRPRLEATAIQPPDVLSVDPVGPQAGTRGGAEGDGLVVGVVQQLDLQPIPRPVQLPDHADQLRDDPSLVEHRQLHRDERQVFARQRGAQQIQTADPSAPQEMGLGHGERRDDGSRHAVHHHHDRREPEHAPA